MESMLFGAFTVLFTIAIWILLYREKVRSRSFTNKMLFVTSTVMYVLSVAVRQPTLARYTCLAFAEQSPST